MGGILPTDSVALEKRRQLRQQRHLEYNDFISRREQSDAVSKVRTELSRERDAELAKSRAALGSRKKVETGSSAQGHSHSDYSSVRAKAFAQEKQYTSGSLGYSEPVEKNREPTFPVQDGSVRTQLNYVTPHFGSAPSPPPRPSDNRDVNYSRERKTWDEDERDLMQWTQDKARSLRQKLQTQQVGGRSSPNDSPSSAKPLPGWGKSYSAEQKENKLKQKKYAEELFQQMKEKRHGRNRNEVEYRREVMEGSRHKGGSQPVNTNGSRLRDREGLDEFSDARVRERPTVPELKIGKDGNGRRRSPSRHEESSYAAKYPPYPYPVLPHYQYPPGGGPWPPPHPPPPPPPHLAYPYSHYRPDLDRSHAPSMYYQPYYFSPPNNAPPPQMYAPGQSVVYPYNAPPPPRGERDHLDPHSYRDRDLVPDRGRPVREQFSPPNLYRQQNEKPKTFEIGTDRSHARAKNEYRLQLEEQVREKKARELKEKLTKETYDTKKSTEIYDPFGKGGCGAPVRDQHGNLVADLKQMRKINENRLSNNSVKVRPSSVARVESRGSSRLEAKSDSPEKSRLQQQEEQTILTYKDSEGMKKTAQENYRDYLRQQVLEKEKLKKEEKEKERLEELKQLEQVERERKKMQEEYQQEQERQRKKEEELRKKNEAIKLEAERERQKVFMQRQLEAEKEEREQRKIADRELEKKIMTSPRTGVAPYQPRAVWSPPVPTLKHQMELGTLSAGPIPRAETFTEAPFSKFHADVPIRRSNNRCLANSSSDDSVARNKQAFHHAPRNTSSPPVPALRKKLAHVEQESLEQTTDNRSLESVAGDTPRPLYHAMSNRVDHSGITGESPREQKHQRNTEILTKLGAIRMYLQEELIRQQQQQQSETNSEIIERVKQQRPKLAVPTRPKASNTTRYDSSISLPQSESSSQFRSGNGVLRNDAHRRPLGKENMSGVPQLKPESNSILTSGISGPVERIAREPVSGIPSSSSLLNSKNTTSRPPWRVGVLAQPSSKPGSSSTARADSTIETAPGHRGRRQTSPSSLSKSSISTSTLDNMADRTEERMRRLDAIINSQGYDEPSLDGQSIDSNNIAARPLRQRQTQEGEGNGPSGHQPSSQALPQRLQPVPSRHSERSLECDTRYLPIN